MYVAPALRAAYVSICSENILVLENGSYFVRGNSRHLLDALVGSDYVVEG